MRVLHAHPVPSPFTKHTALGYYEENMLEKFLTTFISHKDYFLSSAIMKAIPYLKRDIERKALEKLPFEKIKLSISSLFFVANKGCCIPASSQSCCKILISSSSSEFSISL